MIRLLSCLCYVLLVHSDTLPFSPIQTITLTNNAIDLDMTENGDYLYVTDFRLGVKVFYKQNGVF
jgi:hypothetical protein